jgi:hypothetical protein
VGAGTEKRSNFWAKAENKIFGPTNKKIERQGFFPNVFLNLKKCVIQEKTFAKKTFSVFFAFFHVRSVGRRRVEARPRSVFRLRRT